jgi:hypothetical protein
MLGIVPIGEKIPSGLVADDAAGPVLPWVDSAKYDATHERGQRIIYVSPDVVRLTERRGVVQRLWVRTL